MYTTCKGDRSFDSTYTGGDQYGAMITIYPDRFQADSGRNSSAGYVVIAKPEGQLSCICKWYTVFPAVTVVVEHHDNKTPLLRSMACSQRSGALYDCRQPGIYVKALGYFGETDLDCASNSERFEIAEGARFSWFFDVD